MSAADLNDAGICPTCFNRASGGLIFGDDTNKIVYSDADIECAFVGNPRADGHMMIATQKHYHDMSEAPDALNKKIVCYAKRLMKIIVEVFGCEKVYLCTMCDGPANHYHIQLIPRYSYEKRGSKNFVKERHDYVFDSEKFNLVSQKISNFKYHK